MARHINERLLAEYRVLSQHPVEIGPKPVGEVIGLDRAAKPARMVTADLLDAAAGLGLSRSK